MLFKYSFEEDISNYIVAGREKLDNYIKRIFVICRPTFQESGLYIISQGGCTDLDI
jgi:hypothetical protein